MKLIWKNQKKNGLRLMYVESQVANFLEENKDKYKYALVSNADYFYLNKLPFPCFLIFSNRKVI